MGKSIYEIAEELLLDFSLEELLEMNDLEEETVLSILIEQGLVTEPERRVDV